MTAIPVRGTTFEEQVNGWLVEWHNHTAGYSMSGPGHRASSGVASNYNTPTHHDWRNGAEEDRAEKQRAQWIALAAEAVPRPWYYALQVNARYLATGELVWPPLLPAATGERELLVLQARNRFAAECMKRKGLIG